MQLINFYPERWRTDEVDYDDLVEIIRRSTLLPKQVISVIDRIDAEKQKTVTIGRFLEILSELTQVGSNIFKDEEKKTDKVSNTDRSDTSTHTST